MSHRCFLITDSAEYMYPCQLKGFMRIHGSVYVLTHIDVHSGIHPFTPTERCASFGCPTVDLVRLIQISLYTAAPAIAGRLASTNLTIRLHWLGGGGGCQTHPCEDPTCSRIYYIIYMQLYL